MAFAYPNAGPALLAPSISGYGGYSATPAVIPGYAQPAFGTAYGTAYGAAPFAGDFNNAALFAGAQPAFVGAQSAFVGAAPFAGDFNTGAVFAGAQPIIAGGDFGQFGQFPGTVAGPIVSDFNGLYSGYGASGYDAGFGGYGGFAPTMSGAIAAPVAPARKVWQNGLRRSLVTGHPTRF
jgi:hypothetical protein